MSQMLLTSVLSRFSFVLHGNYKIASAVYSIHMTCQLHFELEGNYSYVVAIFILTVITL